MDLWLLYLFSFTPTTILFFQHNITSSHMFLCENTRITAAKPDEGIKLHDMNP